VTLLAKITEVQEALVTVAFANRDLVIPGYTHLQRAQPVLLAHQLLAYVEMLGRDHARLSEGLRRTNVLPLGAGALAGSGLPIDRRYVARQLGFSEVAANSIDAVSDRDFIVELLADVALLGVHLSRMAEDLILWSTAEFGIVKLDEAFATGSSLMPQKRNPDVLELIRGQAGLQIGSLVGILTLFKGLPLSYNRDFQWDKRVLYHPVADAVAALEVLRSLVRQLTWDRPRLREMLKAEAFYATELVEHLVRRGVAFRQAHATVGRLIRTSEQQSRPLRAWTLPELRRVSPSFGEEALALLDARRAVARKVSWGSTNPRQVMGALRRWRRRLIRQRNQLRARTPIA